VCCAGSLKMSRFKLLKLKYFFFLQTVIAVMIMVTQFMVIHNSISYFDSKETKQRHLKDKPTEIVPLPMCLEKSPLLLGQIFIRKGLKGQGTTV
jgi:hypothetical protein